MKWLKRIYRWWWPDGFIGDWWKDRDAIIEECARKAESMDTEDSWRAAKAIRALKDKQA